MNSDILVRAWAGFLASATGATTALSTIEWRDTLQFCLNIVGTLVAIAAGIYSIRASRRGLKMSRQGRKRV